VTDPKTLDIMEGRPLLSQWWSHVQATYLWLNIPILWLSLLVKQTLSVGKYRASLGGWLKWHVLTLCKHHSLISKWWYHLCSICLMTCLIVSLLTAILYSKFYYDSQKWKTRRRLKRLKATCVISFQWWRSRLTLYYVLRETTVAILISDTNLKQ